MLSCSRRFWRSWWSLSALHSPRATPRPAKDSSPYAAWPAIPSRKVRIKEGGGPSLYKVFGRTAGRIEEFEYSPSYKQAGDKGLVWNEETLLDYVKDPKKFLRAYLDDPNAKSRMAVKFPEEADRQNVIAYLKSLSE